MRELGDVHGQADRAPGVLQAALDRLANPQCGVGREAKALAPVELLARADQAEQTLLDEVGERQALVLIAPRVGGDEAQIGVDEQFLGVQVAALDALCQVDLLGGGEQWVAARVREQLIDGLGDEALGAGLSSRSGFARGESIGVMAVMRGSDMAVLLIRCLESGLYSSIVALSMIFLRR